MIKSIKNSLKNIYGIPIKDKMETIVTINFIEKKKNTAKELR